MPCDNSDICGVFCRDTVWGVLTGHGTSENTPSLVMHEVREIETWILRLLSAPVPVPGKTRVEVAPTHKRISKHYLDYHTLSSQYFSV